MRSLTIFAVIVLLCALSTGHALNCVSSATIASVTASTFQDGNPPSGAIDNNYATRWSGSGVGAYITGDLGSVKAVCSISVAWYQSPVRTFNYVLSVSTDGVTFTQVASGVSIEGPETLQAYPFTSTNARYIRLVVNGNSVNTWASVLEIRASVSGFTHPGILVSKSQLDYVKARITQEPYASMLARAKASYVGKTTYVPTAVPQLRCASGSWNDAHPNDPDNIECQVARANGLAAWTQALIWYYTGDISYATRAINILNAWSSTLTNIRFESSAQYSNGALQAAWMMEQFPRAAELLAHAGNSGWAAADIARFKSWTSTVFLPFVYKGWWGTNNWDFSMIEATINIGIFTENVTAYNDAIAMWKLHVPAYLYLTSDGPKPYFVPGFASASTVDANWRNPPQYVNGLCQETCRDLGHTQMGMSAIINTAETAHIQGNTELYPYHQTRITTAFEFLAYWMNLQTTTVPSYLCGGTLNLISLLPAWEIFYNHYHVRAGLALPNATALMPRIRTNGPFYTDLTMSWDELTHQGTGNV